MGEKWKRISPLCRDHQIFFFSFSHWQTHKKKTPQRWNCCAPLRFIRFVGFPLMASIRQQKKWECAARLFSHCFFLKKRFAIINHPADTAIYLFLFLFFAIGFLCFSSISDWPLPASWAFLKKRGRWWFPGQTRSLSIPLSNRTCPSQCQDPLLWFIRHVKYILDRCWLLTSFSMRLNCPFAASLKYHQRLDDSLHLPPWKSQLKGGNCFLVEIYHLSRGRPYIITLACPGVFRDIGHRDSMAACVHRFSKGGEQEICPQKKNERRQKDITVPIESREFFYLFLKLRKFLKFYSFFFFHGL